mmetsp:Transcript_27220/g.40239  ORF Transcript_27220/g.40239 Transcript_27220/m.40239 type:complete len:241 (-) Transcript_27220:8-730(-)
MTKVTRHNAAADGIVVATGGDELHFIPVHNAHELFANVLSTPHCARLDVVFKAPWVGEFSCFPCFVDCEQSEVVTLRLVEPRTLLICLRLLVPGSIEHTFDAKHRYNCQHLFGALFLHRLEQHLRQVRVQRKLSHFATKTGQQAFIVERTQPVKVFHSLHHNLRRRGIHKVEGQQVVDAHSFQLQHGVAEVCALDFRNGEWQHLLTVSVLGVEAEAFAWPCSPGATTTLVGRSLRNWHHN